MRREIRVKIGSTTNGWFVKGMTEARNVHKVKKVKEVHKFADKYSDKELTYAQEIYNLERKPAVKTAKITARGINLKRVVYWVCATLCIFFGLKHLFVDMWRPALGAGLNYFAMAISLILAFICVLAFIGVDFVLSKKEKPSKR